MREKGEGMREEEKRRGEEERRGGREEESTSGGGRGQEVKSRAVGAWARRAEVEA